MDKPKDPNKAAMKLQREQMDRLSKLSLPELEELKLTNPELVGLLEAEQLGPSALEDVSTDPRLAGMQMQALTGMQDRAESGLTTEDKYAMEELLGQAAGQERSQRASIEQEMARRGTGGSGQDLMMKLQSQQASGNQGRRQAMEMAQQAAQGKQSALANMQQMAGQMEGADYQRQAGAASAKDRIAAANAQNRQQVAGQNLSARQQIANQQAALRNQETQYNTGINQQQFQNELAKAGAQGGVAGNMSNIAASGAQKPGGLQSGLSGAATGAGIGNSIVPGVGAGYGAAIGGAAGLLSSFEDGGVVNADARRPADIQNDMQHEYRNNEDKQHNQFKKKYMKRVHDELSLPIEEAKKEVTRAANGAVFSNDDLFNMDAIKSQGQDPSQLDRPELRTTKDYAENNIVDAPEESGLDGDKLAAGLGALSKLMGDGKQKARPALKLKSAPIQMPENSLAGRLGQPQQFANQFADGGTMYASDGEGDIVDSGMESYAGDRVDAKINDGEAVLNVPQQQRFMDLVRGKIGVDELGDEDIVEGVPREYRDEMHEELEEENEGLTNGEEGDKVEGLKKLLEALGRS